MNTRLVLSVLGIAAVVCASAIGGCESQDGSDIYANLPTKSAQQDLFDGISPVVPKVRWRRDLPAATPAPEFVRYPFDPDAPPITEEERAKRAEVEDEIARNIADSDWPTTPEAGKERVVFMDTLNRKEYEFEYDVDELAAFGALAYARGVNNPTDDVDVPEAHDLGGDAPLKDQQAWSNAIDSRVDKEVSGTYPVNDVRLRKVGLLNGGCSGNLIGRRLVLTAAHCVLDASYSVHTHYFEARRSATTIPYGTEYSVGVWWSGQWESNGCSGPGAYDYDGCVPNDWAIVLLRDDVFMYGNFGYTHPGWLGYDIPDYHQHAHVAAYAYNDGYPSCTAGLLGKPSPCISYAPYGQLANCTLSLPEFPSTGSTYAVYHHGCDNSAGHSGSSLVSTFANGSTTPPYVIGIHMFEYCYGSSTTNPGCGSLTGDLKAHPSGMRAITQYLKDLITDKRALYP